MLAAVSARHRAVRDRCTRVHVSHPPRLADAVLVNLFVHARGRAVGLYDSMRFVGDGSGRVLCIRDWNRPGSLGDSSVIERSA